MIPPLTSWPARATCGSCSTGTTTPTSRSLRTTQAPRRSTTWATRRWHRCATPRTSGRDWRFLLLARRQVVRERLARRQDVLDERRDFAEPLDGLPLALLEHPHLCAKLLLAP